MKTRWTADMDHRARELRRAGTPWPRIDVTLGLPADASRKRIRDTLGEADPIHTPAGSVGPSKPAAKSSAPTLPISHDRDGNHVLPPGHPTSWGAITEGTILEGRECTA